MSAKILVLGANGQLGAELLRIFGETAIGLTHADIEITDPTQTAAVLKAYHPELVINAAGIVKTEWCELNAASCLAVNAQGAGNVAQAANDIGAAVVYISTDYVFDGEKTGYTEADQTHTINVYGESKLAGERLVQQANPHHYIIRTSWLFGFQAARKGYDFPRLMLKYAKEQPVVRVVDDQVGSPTYTKDLVFKMKELIAAKVPYGIYHVTNQGQCSWYEFAKTIFAMTNNTAKLVAIPSSASGSVLRRPKNSVLLNAKLATLEIAPLRPWQEALAEYIQELRLLPNSI